MFLRYTRLPFCELIYLIFVSFLHLSVHNWYFFNNIIMLWGIFKVHLVPRHSSLFKGQKNGKFSNCRVIRYWHLFNDGCTASKHKSQMHLRMFWMLRSIYKCLILRKQSRLFPENVLLHFFHTADNRTLFHRLIWGICLFVP